MPARSHSVASTYGKLCRCAIFRRLASHSCVNGPGSPLENGDSTTTSDSLDDSSTNRESNVLGGVRDLVVGDRADAAGHDDHVRVVLQDLVHAGGEGLSPT